MFFPIGPLPTAVVVGQVLLVLVLPASHARLAPWSAAVLARAVAAELRSRLLLPALRTALQIVQIQDVEPQGLKRRGPTHWVQGGGAGLATPVSRRRDGGIITRIASHGANPLLTISDVARRMGMSEKSAARLISSGVIRSLDRGLLAQSGRYDVPVVRESWLHDVEEELDERGTSRIDPHAQGFHPAVQIVLAFLDALKQRDADAAHALSSARTRALYPERRNLLRDWRSQIGRSVLGKAAVATAAYPLPIDQAVAVRLMGDPLPFTIKVVKPAVFMAVAVLPLIPEEESWRLDLPLYQRRAEWLQHAGVLR